MTPVARPSILAREARPVAEREQVAEADVLARGEPALGDLLAERLVLLAELLRVGARVEQAVDPRVGVAERLCDPVGRDLERAQHGGGPFLRARDRTVVRVPERERHEHEREQHESAHDEPAPERGGGS